jgi:hypothetical protein
MSSTEPNIQSRDQKYEAKTIKQETGVVSIHNNLHNNNINNKLNPQSKSTDPNNIQHPTLSPPANQNKLI